MRILYVDVDSLRADHLGCYGYHRDTTPNIDALAREGVRFDACYASDAPCLPSRTALCTGRFGIRNGVVSHGGARAELYPDGDRRGFRSTLAETSWAALFRQAGIARTCTITSFAERHSAMHWYEGFRETYNPGRFGLETADVVTKLALRWLDANARRDAWFLHVNLWDPHTPYRTPSEYGEPFADEPLPSWLTEEVRARSWELPGPHSAQEVNGFSADFPFAEALPRHPLRMTDMAQVRRMVDGYDTGVRYADDHVGRILDALADAGVLDEVAVVVSADHGENLGELGVFGDHHTADHCTSRLPMVVRWPGIEGGRVDTGLHYQVDVAATIAELAGASVPGSWDGRGFAEPLRTGSPAGRPFLVSSQAAWAVQRAVRFDGWMWIRTHHCAFHGWPDEMLFDLTTDPHMTRDMSSQRPDVCARAAAALDGWRSEALGRSDHPDPVDEVLGSGGGWHVRGQLQGYLGRLRDTGRGAWADRLAARYG